MLISIAFLVLLFTITIIFYLILTEQEKEKNEFFHVMAHRFRSPISIIKWNLELLSNNTPNNLNDKQKEYLKEIFSSSEKLNEIIDSLIVLLQLQSNNLNVKNEIVNVKSIIDKIIKELKFKLERHSLRLRQIYPEGKEPTIHSDPKLLSISLRSLIENAVKYTPENGNIDIEVSFFKKYLMIEIKDNGYGIPKDRKSGILADSVNSKDMSFSLYFIKLILKKIQAHISFESEENVGTTFSILLPA